MISDDPPVFASAEALRQHYRAKHPPPRTPVVGRPGLPVTAVMSSAPITVAPARPAAAPGVGSQLDPRFRFAQFCVGDSNRLAQAAAVAVSRRGRDAPPLYSPFFVHGAVGTGKTHLLQAIADATPGALYISGERFMYALVTAIRAGEAEALRAALRGAATLVVDDVQALVGRTVVPEFGYLLNALADAGRQIILSADRPPEDLEAFDTRMRSRMSGGLVVELAPPDAELRLAILAQRCAALGVVDRVAPDALAMMAQTEGATGRALEGALNRLLAHAEMTGRPVDREDAERMLADVLRPAEPRRVKVEDILRVVAKHYNVSRADIISQRRTASVVRPRQVAMYLAKTLTLRSLPEIGRRFGGRDHTTVLHGARKIGALLADDAILADDLRQMEAELREGGA